MSPLKFPRLVFRGHSDGKNFDHYLVEDQEGYDAQLADGWHGTVPEALAVIGTGSSGRGDAPASASGGNNGGNDNSPPTRAELEAKAKELNISFQPNIGSKKLLQRIEIALAGRQ